MDIDELEVTLKMLNITSFRFWDCMIIIIDYDNFHECENFLKNNLLQGFNYVQIEDQIIIKLI